MPTKDAPNLRHATRGNVITTEDLSGSSMAYPAHHSPAAPLLPLSLVHGLLLALLAAGLTYAAHQVWPIYDDGSTWQMLVDDGGRIGPNYPDRPFLGQLWQLMADTGHFWLLASTLHWAAWTATAIVTYLLWDLLVPGNRRLALAAACLALAPVVCKTQLVMVNTVLPGQVGPVLVYGCLVLLLRRPELRPISRHWLKGTVIAGVVVFAVLITEYALAAVFAASAILLMEAASSTDGWKRRLPGTALFVSSAMGAYLIYTRLGEVPLHKTGLSLMSLENTVWRLLSASGRLVSTVWHVGLGGVLEEVGRIQFGSTYFVAAGLVGILTAVAITGAAGWSGALAGLGRENLYRHRTVLSLLAGIALSIAPVVVLGRTFVGDFQTRTLLPALPLAAITSLLMLCLLLPQRLRWVLIPLCGFLVGYGNTAKTLHALDERRLVAEWGNELRNYVSD
jgi:hypothetical protein